MLITLTEAKAAETKAYAKAIEASAAFTKADVARDKAYKVNREACIKADVARDEAYAVLSKAEAETKAIETKCAKAAEAKTRVAKAAKAYNEATEAYQDYLSLIAIEDRC